MLTGNSLNYVTISGKLFFRSMKSLNSKLASAVYADSSKDSENNIKVSVCLLFRLFTVILKKVSLEFLKDKGHAFSSVKESANLVQ